ncbi:MAG: hypothetical protein WAM29_01295 [Methylocella sp.]
MRVEHGREEKDLACMEVMIVLHAADIDERRPLLRASSKRRKVSLILAAKKDGRSMFRANGCNDPAARFRSCRWARARRERVPIKRNHLIDKDASNGTPDSLRASAILPMSCRARPAYDTSAAGRSKK